VGKAPREDFVVTGKVVFENVSRPFEKATLYVKLEDVSRQDALSVIVSEQVIKNVEITREEVETGRYRQIDFILRGSIKDSKGMYIISALLDVDRDGRMGIGDYITQEYYPVLTHGNPRFAVVHVKEII
jgi:hypothetical protein